MPGHQEVRGFINKAELLTHLFKERFPPAKFDQHLNLFVNLEFLMTSSSSEAEQSIPKSAFPHYEPKVVKPLAGDECSATDGEEDEEAPEKEKRRQERLMKKCKCHASEKKRH